MSPPYLRLTDRRKTSANGDIYVWHLRIAQPNVSSITDQVMHSMEHFLGDYMCAAEPDVITVAPMGCRTGFYIASTIEKFDDMSKLLADVLGSMLRATDVPHANVVQCGWAANHSLEGAQNIASWLLDRRADWADPGPDALEL
ncbi:S-ribosylhomocysteine lyase [Amycolatopsis alkalitolerans]|uniref:S-ribosylhomocysteine lyase n=2 Tax=Amycolatopsis alkalitolerans TaxID=2547244 RepID=A0A5C4LV03_9PSEU|nr:S-ribosylhomocysteine lyase [Amycolatopsis alkalitolerans]